MSSNAYNPAGSTASSGFAGAPLPPGMGLQNNAAATDATLGYGVTLANLEAARQRAMAEAVVKDRQIGRQFAQGRAAANGSIGSANMANSPSAVVRAYSNLLNRESGARAQNSYDLTNVLGGVTSQQQQAGLDYISKLAAISRAVAAARGDAAQLMPEVVY